MPQKYKPTKSFYNQIIKTLTFNINYLYVAIGPYIAITNGLPKIIHCKTDCIKTHGLSFTDYLYRST